MGDRQAVERAKPLAARLHLVGLRGGFGGHLRYRGDDSIYRGIDAVDLLEVFGERFAGREFFRTNELGHLDCAGETERGDGRLGFERCVGEERRSGNPHHDFAASRLVWDHVGDFIIRGTGTVEVRPHQTHSATGEALNGAEVMVGRGSDPA